MIVTSPTVLRFLKLTQRITCNAAALAVLYFGIYGQTVQPQMLDSFGRISNDDLQARVLLFQQQLANDGSTGFVILDGPKLINHFNQRRIIGCCRFMKLPEENLQFKFANDQDEIKVEFWKIPKGFASATFVPSIPDFKLDLTKPVEMTVSQWRLTSFARDTLNLIGTRNFSLQIPRYTVALSSTLGVEKSLLVE